MTVEQGSSLVVTVFCVAVLAYFRLSLYPGYLTDRLRQNMFMFRDELFDLAIAHKIPFDHPRYVSLRWRLNGYVSLADQFSIIRMVRMNQALKGTALLQAIGEEEADRDRRAARLPLGTDALKALHLLERRVHMNVFRHLVLRAPILITLVLAMSGIVRAIQGQARALRQVKGEIADRLDDLASASGKAASARPHRSGRSSGMLLHP